jgi:hypothetical protein
MSQVYNTDYANNSRDMDYLFPRVDASDSFLLKESGRFGKWRKVGRAGGYAREGFRFITGR